MHHACCNIIVNIILMHNICHITLYQVVTRVNCDHSHSNNHRCYTSLILQWCIFSNGQKHTFEYCSKVGHCCFFSITFCKIATDVTKRCKDKGLLYRSAQTLMLGPFPDCWHVHYKVSSKFQLFPDFGARPCFARIGESKSPQRRPEVSAKAHLTDQRSKWNLVFFSKIVWRASLCLW